MDQKTRALRAQNKRDRQALAQGNFESLEPLGLGRKNKKRQTFPKVICEHIEGGKKVYVRKQRTKNGRTETYSIPVVIGGKRCTKTATITGRTVGKERLCLEHLGGASQ